MHPELEVLIQAYDAASEAGPQDSPHDPFGAWSLAGQAAEAAQFAAKSMIIEPGGLRR
jgi:hypothetical protein